MERHGGFVKYKKASVDKLIRLYVAMHLTLYLDNNKIMYHNYLCRCITYYYVDAYHFFGALTGLHPALR